MLAVSLRHLKRDKKAVSNVIVAMLSLVLITIIVGNVVLWSYQMNQLDLERMQENVVLLDVAKATHSTWFTSEKEYLVNAGTRISGTFADTKSTDGSFEAFREEKAVSDIYRLDLTNSFTIDLSTYPLEYIQGIELSIIYNVTDDGEKWFLKAYNWSANIFSDVGFNMTGGSQPVSGVWNNYSLSVTEEWTDYVGANGVLLIKFIDEEVNLEQTVVEIDFLGMRIIIDGTILQLRNSSPFTTHVVGIWINNMTHHQRYNANLYMNSGENATYVRPDIRLPKTQFIAKIATEKGNIFVFP